MVAEVQLPAPPAQDVVQNATFANDETEADDTDLAASLVVFAEDSLLPLLFPPGCPPSTGHSPGTSTVQVQQAVAMMWGSNSAVSGHYSSAAPSMAPPDLVGLNPPALHISSDASSHVTLSMRLSKPPSGVHVNVVARCGEVFLNAKIEKSAGVDLEVSNYRQVGDVMNWDFTRCDPNPDP